MTEPPAEIPNSVMKLERDDTHDSCCLSPTFDVKQEMKDSQCSADPMTHSTSSDQHVEQTIQKIKKEPCGDTPLCRQESNIPAPWKRPSSEPFFSSGVAATMQGQYPARIIRTNDGGTHKVNSASVAPSTTVGGLRLPLEIEPYSRSTYTPTTTSPHNYVTRQSKKRKTKFIPAAKFIHSESYSLATRRPQVNEREDGTAREWKEKQALWQSSVISYEPGFNISPPFLSPRNPNDIGPYYHERVHYPSPLQTDDNLQYYTREGENVDSVGQSRKTEPTASSSSFYSPLEENIKSAGYQAREPVIKDVVSLAQATQQQTSQPLASVGKGLGKRSRKIDESGDLAEKPESGESGTSDTDDTLNAGKFISDLAQPYVNIPDDHQVAHINGLLSLPSNRETRYGITYGELKRRCNSPESLTRVDLVAYVRHSKSSGRNLLDKYRIVSSGNRTSSPTVLSKMCENEARVLGDGILKMNMDYFPGKLLAQTAVERVMGQTTRTGEQKNEEKDERKHKIKEKMNQIEITRSMLKEIYDLLLSEKDSEEIKRFELASHTFGTANLMNHLTLFDRFFEDYQTSLATKKK